MAAENEKILQKEIKKAVKKNRTKNRRLDNFLRTRFAQDIRDKPFWIEDDIEHQKALESTNGKCCFWHTIGLPEKEHLMGKTEDGKEIFEKKAHPMYDYEIDVYSHILANRYTRIKKAAGMGITTLLLGMMAYWCVRDDTYKGQEMVIVTGPRIDLASDELDRLAALFLKTDYVPKRVGDSLWINTCKITAYPSHTFDTARGLDKCRLFFVDEADFFPQTQITPVMTVLERYEAKSHPFVILNSTTNIPVGLYAQMDEGKYPMFKTIEVFYEKGLGKIYTPYEIEQAKLMPSFECEYNGKYGIGEGNIFSYKLVDACTEEYDLNPCGYERIISVDPGYGSSKFAIVIAERRDEVVYILEAEEFARPTPSVMVELLVRKSRAYQCRVAVDDSSPGLIQELQRYRVETKSVSFRSKLDEMTMMAVNHVKEQRVRIHPKFTSLRAQLKSVRLNERGHPDKNLLSFDLGDAFMMAIFSVRDSRFWWVALC